MKLITSLLIGLFLANSISAFAQNQVDTTTNMSKYNLYADVGTIAVLNSTSLNFEFNFATSKSKKINWYGRIGGGGAAVFYGPVGFGGFGGVTMLTGRKNHHFEASGGAFLGTDTGAGYGDGFFALPFLDLGYRFQKPKKSFIFRAKAGVLGVGIGLGYAF